MSQQPMILCIHNEQTAYKNIHILYHLPTGVPFTNWDYLNQHWDYDMDKKLHSRKTVGCIHLSMFKLGHDE